MKDPQEAISTNGLQKILLKTKPDDIPAYYEAHKNDLIRGDRPFMDYMNARIKEKGLSKQQVFLAADLPEKYGYKLLDEEKHTQKRDIYLRLFYGARLTLQEAQRALRLAGQEQLYARIRRDCALIIGFNNSLSVDKVNEILQQYELETLSPCGSSE